MRTTGHSAGDHLISISKIRAVLACELESAFVSLVACVFFVFFLKSFFFSVCVCFFYFYDVFVCRFLVQPRPCFLTLLCA